MKRFLITISILMLSTLAFSATPAQQLQTLLSNIQSMQANFKQVVTNETGDMLEQSTGMVYLQRPGKFYWMTQGNTKQILIANGKKLWVYNVDLEQVTIQNLQQTLGNTPAQLLAGSNTDFANNYEVQALNNIAGLTGFVLTPKAVNSSFKSMTLYFKGAQLAVLQLTDQIGQITKVTFSDIKNNISIPSKQFAFTIPKGVDVVDTTKQK